MTPPFSIHGELSREPAGSIEIKYSKKAQGRSAGLRVQPFEPRGIKYLEQTKSDMSARYG
jgi:hypothetical protein